MIHDHLCSLELQEYKASALVQTVEALLILTCWKGGLFFGFSPVLLLLQSISNWDPMTTGQDACCTLEICREPPAGWKYLTFGIMVKPAEQLSAAHLAVRSSTELHEKSKCATWSKENQLSFCGQLRSKLWLVFSISSSANPWLHSQEALGFDQNQKS